MTLYYETKVLIIKSEDMPPIDIMGADIGYGIPYRMLFYMRDIDRVIISTENRLEEKELSADNPTVKTYIDWFAEHPEDIPPIIINEEQ